MNKVELNSERVLNSVSTLKQCATYYSNKKESFSSSNLSCDKLSNYLTKISNIYGSIKENIISIYEYLESYTNDITGLENKLSNKSGSTSFSDVNQILNNIYDSINACYIDDTILFEIKTYNEMKYEFPKIQSVAEDDDNILALLGVSVLAFLEGALNVVENVTDGVAMIGVGVCSVADLILDTNSADALANAVKYDWSKELYYSATDAFGLEDYADSTAAQVCSIAGNIVGHAALSVLTGGIASSAFGPGTTAASKANAIMGALSNAFSSAGSQGESALQSGATNVEAVVSATWSAAFNSLTGFLGGKLDAKSVYAGTYGDFGKATGYAISSFALGATEPIVEEFGNILIYKYDDQYIFTSDYISEIGLSMLFSGGANCLGTIGNIFSGVKFRDAELKRLEKYLIETDVTMPLHLDLKEARRLYREQNFNIQVRERFDNSPIDGAFIAWIDSNLKKYNIALKGENIDSYDVLKKAIDLEKSFLGGVMQKQLYDTFNGQLSLNEIKKQVKDNTFFCDIPGFKKANAKDNVTGFNCNGKSYINVPECLKYGDDYLKSTIFHENMHQISNSSKPFSIQEAEKLKLYGFIDSAGSLNNISRSGVHYYLNDVNCNSVDLFRGLNESMTAFFEVENFPNIMTGYKLGVQQLDRLDTARVIDRDLIAKAYINNDVFYVLDTVESLMPGISQRFAMAFDNATLNGDDEELASIVTDLIRVKVGREFLK